MNNQTFEEAFKEIANGDADAEEFCKTVFEWVHMIDDLVDKDKPINPDALVLCLVKFTAVLTKNPFYQRNRDDLLQALTTSAFAFAASERFKGCGDVMNQLSAEVLKSEYMNVFFRVAFLTGGTRHQLECDKKFRGYSFG